MNKWISTYLLLCLFVTKSQATELLDRRVNLKLNNTPVHEALAQLANAASCDLAYNTRIIEANLKVSIRADNWPVREVLLNLLGNKFVYSARDNSLIIKKSKRANDEIQGYLKDPDTGERLAGATLYDQKSLRATTTDQNGYYQLKVPTEAYVAVRMLHFSDTVIRVTSQAPRVQTLALRSLGDQNISPPELDTKLKLLRAEYRMERFFAAQLNRLHCANLDTVDMRRPFQVSLVPRIGTNHTLDAQVQNRFSVNLIAGHARALKGLEFTGVASFMEEDVTGLQFSGVFSLIRGKMRGWVASGAWSSVHGRLSGVLSYAKDAQKSSIQASGLMSITHGGTLSTQLSGAVSEAIDISVVQAAGLVSIANDVQGVQASSVFNLVNHMRGLQAAGLINVSTQVKGAQIAVLINSSKRVSGVQIGLFNTTKTCDCVQIGLINKIGKRWLPFVNMSRGGE
jgi:CarboxypepD_reg-like domain